MNVQDNSSGSGLSPAGEPLALQRSLGVLQRYLGALRPDAMRTIQAGWPSMVGARIAELCWIHSVRDGLLVVQTDEPAVAQQLEWATRDLLDGLNALLGSVELREVRVQVVAARPHDDP